LIVAKEQRTTGGEATPNADTAQASRRFDFLTMRELRMI
jgi:hypothetical protein